MKCINLLVVLLATTGQLFAQNLPDSCKLNIGTNLGGLADYGTEIPFVDLMKTCRIWYSKNADGSGGFDTETADSLAYRADGYPTFLPQTLAGHSQPQTVATIWANNVGWTPGKYTVLFDGTGTISFGGSVDSLTMTSAHRYTFYPNVGNANYIELLITASSAADPIRNIRILMPGFETTYTTQPFNPIWLNTVRTFKSVRFMDWTQTNNWGQIDGYTWESTTLFNWNERAKMDNYTWATNKGVPYEMVIKLMNDYDLDGWVCVPHRASNDYIDNMAAMFHTQLEPQRELTVEYSNELWNWMFGQANWSYTYGAAATGLSWPECIVPYIQNCLNRWTLAYGNDVGRIKRAVGLQTGWADVSRRIVYNLNPNSFDVIAPTYYFGLGAEADSTLDILGSAATAADIAYWARRTRNTEEKVWMREIKTTISDSLHKPMYFYEGGQHLTPTPFGTMPTYENALLDIQRDTAMYNLYNEWYDFVRTLQSGTQPLRLMNFSLVSDRSAQYGSWGILETMNQDLSLINAPKYKATLRNMAKGNCFTIVSLDDNKTTQIANLKVFPNPVCTSLTVESTKETAVKAELFDVSGKLLNTFQLNQTTTNLNLSDVTTGVYFLKIYTASGQFNTFKVSKQ